MINKHNTDITVSVADVHAHIEHQMMCKGVMLERIVADLSEVIHHSQRACFVKSEHDTTVFEPKNVATYVRTVDQMANLLKMEHFQSRSCQIFDIHSRGYEGLQILWSSASQTISRFGSTLI